MIRICSTIDFEKINVVHVNRDFPCEDQILEDHVHHRLEGCGRISEAKKHHHGFKKSQGCYEGGLLFISLFDVYVVIPLPQVQFCKSDGPFDDIQKFLD